MENRCRLQSISTKSKHSGVSYLTKVVMVLILFIVTAVSGIGNFAAAQQLTVTGTVIDQLGAPLGGVTISVKGTTAGALTDSDGKYILPDVAPNATLTYSFVGMTAQDIMVNGRAKIDVTLAEASIGLEEVVVVGYGTQTKKTLSGAVSSINNESLTRTVTPMVSNALVGKVAGVTSRITDGRPGGATALSIRNFGTPLYIIDGVPRTEVDFNALEMDNIESISILKDASASIYGLLAANGVVLITTKMGKINEKPIIKIDGYVGLQSFTRFPHPPKAYTYMLGQAESAQNQGTGTTITPAILDSWKAGTYDPANGIDFRSFDYYQEVVGKNFPAPQTSLNVSAQGATEKSSYFFSVGTLKQDAPIKGFFYKRNSLQLNLEARLTKGLKVGSQVSARMENNRSAGLPGWDDYANVFLAIIRNWPTERPYANDNPNYLNNTHSININPGTYKESITGFGDINNRVFNGNLYSEYDFGGGLKAKGTMAYGYRDTHNEFFEYTYNAYTYDRLANTYNIVPGGGNQNPFRATQRGQTEDIFGQFQLSYNKKFGKNTVSAVTAYERSKETYVYLLANSIPPSNYILPQFFANVNALTNTFTYSARASYIGRFNYNYSEKYLVEILGRYDGSYLYAPGKRWGLFPGVSLGWRISNEPFFESLKNIFSEFKIRASYGTSGSETGVTAFGYLNGFDWDKSNYIFNGTTYTGVQPRGLPVTNLSWITNKNKNVGVDFTMLNGKIDGQFDVFERRVTGIPAARYDVLLPSEVGYSLPNENLNTTANRGVEGMIFYNGKIGGESGVNFKVGVNSTLSRMRNIESYKPRFGNSYDQYRNSTEDRWSNITWGYHIVGQFQSQEQIDNYPVNVDGSGNRSLLPGDLIYEDLNKDGVINTMDQKPIGYANGSPSYNTVTALQTIPTTALPFMSFGLNATFDYKGLDLLIDFAGATMQSFIRNNDLKMPFYTNGAGTDWLIGDRWHHADPFDLTSAWIPGTNPPTRGNNTTHSNFNKTNDFYLTNITYLRLRDLELGYNIPERLLKKVNITKLRVYTNISSLFSIDNMKKYDLDPETSATNGMVFPQTRVYNFGFVLTL
jgi:TonB-linked SusC/RagA family outer membrane protein